MRDTINVLIADILNLPYDKITDNLTMKNVDTWNSLKHMELIVALEQTFSFQLSFEEIVSMQSVYKIREVLNSKKVQTENGN